MHYLYWRQTNLVSGGPAEQFLGANSFSLLKRNGQVNIILRSYSNRAELFISPSQPTWPIGTVESFLVVFITGLHKNVTKAAAHKFPPTLLPFVRSQHRQPKNRCFTTIIVNIYWLLQICPIYHKVKGLAILYQNVSTIQQRFSNGKTQLLHY